MKTHTSKRSRKDPNVYPPGLDYQKAQALAKYYDDRKDVDFFGEAELIDSESHPVWVQVPEALLPQVRKLISRYRKSA